LIVQSGSLCFEHTIQTLQAGARLHVQISRLAGPRKCQQLSQLIDCSQGAAFFARQFALKFSIVPAFFLLYYMTYFLK
jgi:hypothetical protein